MRQRKTVLVIRYIEIEPFNEAQLIELKNKLNVSLVLQVGEESPKEYNDYPLFEIIEL